MVVEPARAAWCGSAGNEPLARNVGIEAQRYTRGALPRKRGAAGRPRSSDPTPRCGPHPSHSDSQAGLHFQGCGP